MEIRISRHDEDEVGYLRATGVVYYCDVDSKEELSIEVACLVTSFVWFNYRNKIDDCLQKQAVVSLLDEIELL